MIMLKNYDIGYIIEVRWYKVIKLVICLDIVFCCLCGIIGYVSYFFL